MHRKNENLDTVVRGEGHATKMITFGGADAVTDKGTAIAFGNERVARVLGSVGYAISFGSRGIADAMTAVSILSSNGIAISPSLAVVLNHAGKAIGRKIAIAGNLDSEAHSESLAVAVGPRGLADGFLAIALGKEGRVVAREGGTIALAFYDQHPGHWENAHGCDPTWLDGEDFLSGLRCAKVGENGIRANFIYQLDNQGAFKEIGPAGDRRNYDDSINEIERDRR